MSVNLAARPGLPCVRSTMAFSTQAGGWRGVSSKALFRYSRARPKLPHLRSRDPKAPAPTEGVAQSGQGEIGQHAACARDPETPAPTHCIPQSAETEICQPAASTGCAREPKAPQGVSRSGEPDIYKRAVSTGYVPSLCIACAPLPNAHNTATNAAQNHSTFPAFATQACCLLGQITS